MKVFTVEESAKTTIRVSISQYSQREECMIEETLNHTHLTRTRICSTYASETGAKSEAERLTREASVGNDRLKYDFELTYCVIEQEVVMSGDPGE